MSGALRLLWAVAERAAPRAMAASLLVLSAAFVDPGTFGLYSWVVLALSLFQSFGDSACRQYAVFAISSERGRQTVRHLQTVSGSVGAAFVLITIAVVASVNGPNGGAAWQLLPIASGPLFTALGLPWIARAQREDLWRQLATGQVVASTATVALSIGALLAWQNLVAVALQYPIAELLMFLWARRLVARRPATAPDREFEPGGLGALAAYSLIGWSQSQLDRVLVGGVLGTAGLALYSTGTSLGRAAGDAVAASTANVVRSAQSRDDVADEREHEPNRIIAFGMLAAALASIALMAAMKLLAAVLPPDWRGATDLAIVVSVAAVPAVVIWSSTAILQRLGGIWRTVPIRLLGVVAAVPIALAARVDLLLAGTLVVVRDLLLMTIIVFVLRQVLVVRLWVLGAGLVVMLGAAAVFVMSW